MVEAWNQFSGEFQHIFVKVELHVTWALGEVQSFFTDSRAVLAKVCMFNVVYLHFADTNDCSPHPW